MPISILNASVNIKKNRNMGNKIFAATFEKRSFVLQPSVKSGYSPSLIRVFAVRIEKA